ncbi:MAG: TetR family transcriptional regulator C-terminal domain-containing protein [Sinobacteraceae bacterium]|nr:TetR family transcriptional regulator C-terminal domain-containing protein [Rhodocyclaceae bacterium]MCP5308749.1 TetR family transcriptional regulator C-terminal domain-containing protein [Zoogloeaceae bacterium]MCP5466072.1 TetR family transcriptional regulator C-terminal domain-containing protein [Nevskiaceae bacterium]HQV08666.1 TetR/AcrR family transcriptional regulator [Thauera sp.]
MKALRTESRPPADTRPKGRVRRRQEGAILKAAERVFARAGFEGGTMAEIAALAGLPKANLHYYFGSKDELYRAVLDNILSLWLAETEVITRDADPARALTAYVTAKMHLTATRPDASRVFANEVIHGATHIGDFLRSELHGLVAQRAAVIDHWATEGRIAPVDATHLFFTIWAATQTYADFESQVCAVLGKARLGQADLARATTHVVTITLRSCGLEPAGPPHTSLQ